MQEDENGSCKEEEEEEEEEEEKEPMSVCVVDMWHLLMSCFSFLRELLGLSISVLATPTIISPKCLSPLHPLRSTYLCNL